MPLATFTDLLGEIRNPAGLKTQFLPVTNPYPTGPIDTGGGQSPDPTGPVYSGGGTAPPAGTTSSGVNCNNPFNYMTYPSCWFQTGTLGATAACVGDFLLRAALFILGLMCIAGAIYLYKGSGVLAIPSKIARGAVHATKTAVKAVASSDE